MRRWLRGEPLELLNTARLLQSISGMRLYLVHFSSKSFLERAFGRLMDADRVVSCSVELESGRIRFLAPPRTALHLVERFYLEGGMTWCTMHDRVAEEVAATSGRLRAVCDTRHSATLR